MLLHDLAIASGYHMNKGSAWVAVIFALISPLNEGTKCVLLLLIYVYFIMHSSSMCNLIQQQ